MPARFFLFLLLLTSLFGGAQSNYTAGWVITDTGDTLSGFINHREWHHNPSKITFKTSRNGNHVQTFTAGNASAFKVGGYESYKKFTASISSNVLSFAGLKAQADTTTVVKEVFLKEIVNGDKLALYAYRDAVKERFYIYDKRQAKLQELIYIKTLNDMQEHTQAVYRQQLTAVAMGDSVPAAETKRLIQAAGYQKSDLARIVRMINAKDADMPRIKQPGGIDFFIALGVHSNTIRYSGESLITVDRLDANGFDKFKDRIVTQAYLPRFAGGMNFYVNPSVRRLFIRAEFAAAKMKSTTTSYYKHSSYTATEIEYTYNLSAWQLSFMPQVGLYFYNTPVIKAYIAAGGSFSYFVPGRNDMEKRNVHPPGGDTRVQERFMPFKTHSLATAIQAGIEIRQRVMCSFLWGNPVELSNFASGGTSVKTGLLALSAGYRF